MAIEFEILRKSETPPSNWRAVVPETGFKVEHYDYNAFIKGYESHCLANNIYLGPYWVEELHSRMCAENQPLWRDYCKRAGKFPTRRNVAFAAIMSFLNVLRKWVADIADGKEAFVDQETANHRASICALCPMNSKKISWGCGSCTSSFNSTISVLLSGRTTPDAGACGSCQVCGCAINAAVWFPITAQGEGLTDQMKEDFSKIDFCWKRKELGL